MEEIKVMEVVVTSNRKEWLERTGYTRSGVPQIPQMDTEGHVKF